MRAWGGAGYRIGLWHVDTSRMWKNHINNASLQSPVHSKASNIALLYIVNSQTQSNCTHTETKNTLKYIKALSHSERTHREVTQQASYIHVLTYCLPPQNHTLSSLYLCYSHNLITNLSMALHYYQVWPNLQHNSIINNLWICFPLFTVESNKNKTVKY